MLCLCSKAQVSWRPHDEAFFLLKKLVHHPRGLLGLAYFEALDPPSCLAFGAHCVMGEVTGRVTSLAALPAPIHSSQSV